MPSKSGDSVAKDVTGIQKRLSYFMLIGCKLSLLALNQLVYGSSPYRGTISKPAALAAGFVVLGRWLLGFATVVFLVLSLRFSFWRGLLWVYLGLLWGNSNVAKVVYSHGHGKISGLGAIFAQAGGTGWPFSSAGSQSWSIPPTGSLG